MQLTVDIEFNELLKIIKQLPAFQIEKIKTEVNEKTVVNKPIVEKSEFQEFLLSGPVMSEEQYQGYLENRQHFNKWRSK